MPLAIVSVETVLVIRRRVKGFGDGRVGPAPSGPTPAIAFGRRPGDGFGRKPVFSVTMALIACGSVLQVLAPASPRC
mgnify:CR=1 FL=1